MSNTRKAASSAPIFAALGDIIRLELVSRLSDGKQRSIAQLSEGLALTRQGVTKHLHVLQRAGVISCERVGRESRFTISPAPIAKAGNYLARVSRQWDEAVKRLRASVEE